MTERVLGGRDLGGDSEHSNFLLQFLIVRMIFSVQFFVSAKVLQNLSLSL